LDAGELLAIELRCRIAAQRRFACHLAMEMVHRLGVVIGSQFPVTMMWPRDR
jgi:hypothetical protein